MLEAGPANVLDLVLGGCVDVIFVGGVEVSNVIVVLLRRDIALVNDVPRLFKESVQFGWVGGPGTGWFPIGAIGGSFEGSEGIGAVGAEGLGEGFGASGVAVEFGLLGLGK